MAGLAWLGQVSALVRASSEDSARSVAVRSKPEGWGTRPTEAIRLAAVAPVGVEPVPVFRQAVARFQSPPFRALAVAAAEPAGRTGAWAGARPSLQPVASPCRSSTVPVRKAPRVPRMAGAAQMSGASAVLPCAAKMPDQPAIHHRTRRAFPANGNSAADFLHKWCLHAAAMLRAPGSRSLVSRWANPCPAIDTRPVPARSQTDRERPRKRLESPHRCRRPTRRSRRRRAVQIDVQRTQVNGPLIWGIRKSCNLYQNRNFSNRRCACKSRFRPIFGNDKNHQEKLENQNARNTGNNLEIHQHSESTKFEIIFRVANQK